MIKTNCGIMKVLDEPVDDKTRNAILKAATTIEYCHKELKDGTWYLYEPNYSKIVRDFDVPLGDVKHILSTSDKIYFPVEIKVKKSKKNAKKMDELINSMPIDDRLNRLPAYLKKQYYAQLKEKEKEN